MKISIRDYKKEDFPMITKWWEESREVGPLESMMPIGSSFIAEIDDEPALAVCLYLTNSCQVAYVENFIGNKKFKGSARKTATTILLDHLTKFAGELGFKSLFCMTEKDVLKSYYEDIGFKRTLDGVATFIKETVCHQ